MVKYKRRRRPISRFILPVAIGALGACAIVFVLIAERVITPGPVYYIALAIYFAIMLVVTALSVA